MGTAVGLRDQRLRVYTQRDNGANGVVRKVFAFQGEYWGRLDERSANSRVAQQHQEMKVDATAEFADEITVPSNGVIIDTSTGVLWWVRGVNPVRQLRRIIVGLERVADEMVATFTLYEGDSTLDGVHAVGPAT